MSSTLESLVGSPSTLYTTSIISFIIARAIIYHVKKNGPIKFAPTVIKYNSYAYSIFSLLLCLGITTSIWNEISSTQELSIRSLICLSPSSAFDRQLRFVFHTSKLYEYVDIFNVLAAGGVVNAHFAIHHFSTMYLTYARVILYPAGWKVFGVLNTMHHAIMYAYFGGATIFSDVLPWTGMLQLVAGIAEELYVMMDVWSGREDCGSMDSLWANVLTIGLLSTYLVLFTGDLRARGEKTKNE